MIVRCNLPLTDAQYSFLVKRVGKVSKDPFKQYREELLKHRLELFLAKRIRASRAVGRLLYGLADILDDNPDLKAAGQPSHDALYQFQRAIDSIVGGMVVGGTMPTRLDIKRRKNES